MEFDMLLDPFQTIPVKNNKSSHPHSQLNNDDIPIIWPNIFYANAAQILNEPSLVAQAYIINNTTTHSIEGRISASLDQQLWIFKMLYRKHPKHSADLNTLFNPATPSSKIGKKDIVHPHISLDTLNINPNVRTCMKLYGENNFHNIKKSELDPADAGVDKKESFKDLISSLYSDANNTSVIPFDNNTIQQYKAQELLVELTKPVAYKLLRELQVVHNWHSFKCISVWNKFVRDVDTNAKLIDAIHKKAIATSEDNTVVPYKENTFKKYTHKKPISEIVDAVNIDHNNNDDSSDGSSSGNNIMPAFGFDITHEDDKITDNMINEFKNRYNGVCGDDCLNLVKNFIANTDLLVEGFIIRNNDFE